MTTTEREQFLAERKTGIGGSDMASVFNLGYGCSRRLFYDKTGTPEDFPRGNDAMELGSLLEPWFRDKYVRITGRAALKSPHFRRHARFPEIVVHADALISREPDQVRDGVLEVKSVSRSVFYKTKREGLPEDYILQEQHALTAFNADWGAFAIGNRDSGELVHWDVERDEAICQAILREAPAFWKRVQSGDIPDRLEPDDKRCQRCEYRRRCQGNALVEITKGDMQPAEDLRDILTEYLERKELLDQAEALYAETQEELKTRLGSRDAVTVGKRKVYYRQSEGRLRWLSKELGEAYRNMRAHLKAKLMESVNENEAEKTLHVSGYERVENYQEKGAPYRTLRVY